MKLTKIDTTLARKAMTVEEYEQGLQYIRDLAQENDTGKLDLTWEMNQLLAFAGGAGYEVLKSTATLVNNRRKAIYCNPEGCADVLVEIVAFSEYDGALKAGMLLSDIREIGPEDINTQLRTYFLYTNHYSKD